MLLQPLVCGAGFAYNPAMLNEEAYNPVDTAKQLLAMESLLGNTDFLPVGRNSLPELDLPEPPVAAAGAVGAASKGAVLQELSPEEKAAALQQLDADEVKPCRKCELCKTRTNTVFGEVNPNADLVFVGEGPGADEDASGRPFVGRAGDLLTKMIAAMGLSRSDVFICNMVKCRPPGNRTPLPEEVAACWDYLVRQLQIIRPKVIVTLGNPATKGLLSTNVGITKMRGVWAQLPDIGPGLGGIPVMPTFHPAYVLRNYSVNTRGLVWSDLQSVMEHLGLKIPQK